MVDWLSPPRRKLRPRMKYFLTVSLNLNSTTIVMDHEAEQGENKYLSQNSVASVTTGLTNNSPKVVFKLYNYYQVLAL